MRSFLSGAITFFLCLQSPLAAQDGFLPPALLSLSSEEGRALFAETEGQRAFLPLISQYTTQETQEFCGVASSVMVLNALGLSAPVDARYDPYPYFTQGNYFGAASDAILPRASITCSGMTIDKFAEILGSHGAATRVVHAGDTSVSAFRDDVAAALMRDDTYVVINYLGSAIGQTEHGGHFSPLGAIAADSDRVLVLDVARFVYPPYWADTAELFAAMNTPDGGNSDRTRGYVVVTRP